jgi:hypothetical protein
MKKEINWEKRLALFAVRHSSISIPTEPKTCRVSPNKN